MQRSRQKRATPSAAPGFRGCRLPTASTADAAHPTEIAKRRVLNRRAPGPPSEAITADAARPTERVTASAAPGGSGGSSPGLAPRAQAKPPNGGEQGEP